MGLRIDKPREWVASYRGTPVTDLTREELITAYTTLLKQREQDSRFYEASIAMEIEFAQIADILRKRRGV